MTQADAVITAYRSVFDDLAELVATLTDADLARTSGSKDWTVAQVLSHLGSGAEISQAGLRAALAGEPNPGMEFNKSVWARWDAMSAREQADGFLPANQGLAELYESLDAPTRDTLRIDVGFLPAPVDVATLVRLRLSELALHGWDVKVAFDDEAVLHSEAAEQLLHQTPIPMAFIAKTDALGGESSVLAVTTTEPLSRFALRLAEPVTVDFAVPVDVDGTLNLPGEAWLRLVAGRLAVGRTPKNVTTTAAADLDRLRSVFRGY
jgi:uncharacterized protein (TIGR03083 family)